MIKTTIQYLNAKKSNIGFVHGFISIFGAVLLSYLTMMCFSKYMPFDTAIKIVPAFILTPMLISFYGIWLLFSKTIIKSLIKLSTLSLVFIILLKVF